MASLILPSAPDIEITLRRSAAARRFSLRVSGLDGRVTLSAPMRARDAEVAAFAQGKLDWIRAARDRAPDRVVVGPGSILTVEGRAVTIVPGPVRAPVLGPDRLLVPDDPARAGLRVAAFLRVLARDRLAQASDGFAARLGRRVSGLVLRDTRSRWGSCTADGVLMFSWRLILAPPEVLDYVAAHEVAHLSQMNHSPAFWRVVAGLMPDYGRHRVWLRQNGALLHSYDFTGTARD